MGLESEGEGLGVKWEGSLIYQDIYNAGANDSKFVPIIFSKEDIKYIPKPLQGSTYYCIDSTEKYEDFYWGLRGESRARKPNLGKLRALPQKETKTNPIMFLSGPIQIELWDQAEWKGIYYEIYQDRPPLLGLVFHHEASAIKIFTNWQERYGKKDSFEELRISIIEGDITGEDPGYSVHISSDLEGITNRFMSKGFYFNPKLVTLISRIHRMNPLSNSKNLYYFKKSYNEFKSYFLVPCIGNMDMNKIVPICKLGIHKDKIHFRVASEIDEMDIDRVIFRE